MPLRWRSRPRFDNGVAADERWLASQEATFGNIVVGHFCVVLVPNWD